MNVTLKRRLPNEDRDTPVKRDCKTKIGRILNVVHRAEAKDLMVTTVGAVAPSGAVVPDGGWQQVQDPTSGKAYCYDAQTGKTSWDKPAWAWVEAAFWVEVANPLFEQSYYYNAKTRETSWERPVGPMPCVEVQGAPPCNEVQGAPPCNEDQGAPPCIEVQGGAPPCNEDQGAPPCIELQGAPPYIELQGLADEAAHSLIAEKPRRPRGNMKKKIERTKAKQLKYGAEDDALEQKLLTYEKSPQPAVRITESQWELIKTIAMVLELEDVKWDTKESCFQPVWNVIEYGEEWLGGAKTPTTGAIVAVDSTLAGCPNILFVGPEGCDKILLATWTRQSETVVMGTSKPYTTIEREHFKLAKHDINTGTYTHPGSKGDYGGFGLCKCLDPILRVNSNAKKVKQEFDDDAQDEGEQYEDAEDEDEQDNGKEFIYSCQKVEVKLESDVKEESEVKLESDVKEESDVKHESDGDSGDTDEQDKGNDSIPSPDFQTTVETLSSLAEYVACSGSSPSTEQEYRDQLCEHIAAAKVNVEKIFRAGRSVVNYGNLVSNILMTSLYSSYPELEEQHPKSSKWWSPSAILCLDASTEIPRTESDHSNYTLLHVPPQANGQGRIEYEDSTGTALNLYLRVNGKGKDHIQIPMDIGVSILFNRLFFLHNQTNQGNELINIDQTFPTATLWPFLNGCSSSSAVTVLPDRTEIGISAAFQEGHPSS